jgi:hypothetical protein
MVMASTLQANLNRVIGVTNPSQYLDAQGAANVWASVPAIAPVHTATTAATSGVYAAGPDPENPGVGATITAPSNATLIIDNHTMLINERALYWLNTDAKTNGVYTVTNPGSVSTKWVLTRSTDADTGYDLHNGSYVTVNAGTDYTGSTHRGKTFVITNTGTGANGAIVLGTDNVTFAVGVSDGYLNDNILNANLATGTDSSGGLLTGVGIYSGGTTSSSTDYGYPTIGRSLKIVPDTASTSISIGTTTSDATYTPAIKPNTTYTLSFYTRTAISLSNTVSLIAIPQQTLGSNLTAITIATTTAVSNGGWTKVTGQFTTSSNHNYLILKVTVTALSLTGQNYYFDNFSMQQTNLLSNSSNELLRSLNIKAGTNGLGLNAVCNVLAGTTNLDAVGASEYF